MRRCRFNQSEQRWTRHRCCHRLFVVVVVLFQSQQSITDGMIARILRLVYIPTYPCRQARQRSTDATFDRLQSIRIRYNTPLSISPFNHPPPSSLPSYPLQPVLPLGDRKVKPVGRYKTTPYLGCNLPQGPVPSVQSVQKPPVR